MTTEAKREAIARIIYPEAFKTPTAAANRVYRNMGYDEARRIALAMADAIMALAEPQVSDDTVRVRSDVFAVLRRHDVGEQCFAEVASILTAAAAPASEPQALSEERDDILYLAQCAKAHADKFPVPGHMLSMCNRIIARFATETQKGSGE